MRVLALAALAVAVAAGPSALVFKSSKDNTLCTLQKHGNALQSVECDVAFGGSSIASNAAAIAQLQTVQDQMSDWKRRVDFQLKTLAERTTALENKDVAHAGGIEDLHDRIDNIELKPGPKGAKGEPGAAGPAGGKGADGRQGIDGAKGAKGEQGDKGKDAPTGTPTPAPTPLPGPATILGEKGPDRTAWGWAQCAGWGPGGAPTWDQVASNCGDFSNIVMAGYRCDGSYVEHHVGKLRAKLKCFMRGADKHSDCPSPQDDRGSGGRYWDNISTDGGKQYSLYHDENWWVLGNNGNRWSDPGRCWEPIMTGSWSNGAGHVLSSGCNQAHDQSSCGSDKYWLYIKGF